MTLAVRVGGNGAVCLLQTLTTFDLVAVAEAGPGTEFAGPGAKK